MLSTELIKKISHNQTTGVVDMKGYIDDPRLFLSGGHSHFTPYFHKLLGSLVCRQATGIQVVHVTARQKAWVAAPYKHQVLTLDERQMGQGYHYLLWLFSC